MKMKVFIIFIFFSIYSFQLTLSNIDCANDYAVDDSYTNDNRQMTDRKNSDLRQMINKKNLEKRFFRKLKSVIELLKKNKNKKFDNAKAFYSRHKLPTKLNYTWPTNDYLDIYKQPRPITAAIIITEKPKDISTSPSELTMTNRLLLRHFLRNPTVTNESSLRSHFPYLLYPYLHRHLDNQKRGTRGDGTIGLADYKEIKKLPNYPDKILIDVREPEEVFASGKIPTSVNIPLKKLVKALARKSDKDEFRKKYAREKPDFNSLLIFHCVEGARAQKAAEQAIRIGYKNVKLYKGSWNDWIKQECFK